ncbi:MAG TPA: MotA/TolQ/ExbB proton channel family protein [Leptospiraceae bacterium]|nr:MotA/TolQ/ExbB proton channel family protein [Leptospiraceae bacterium]
MTELFRSGGAASYLLLILSISSAAIVLNLSYYFFVLFKKLRSSNQDAVSFTKKFLHPKKTESPSDLLLPLAQRINWLSNIASLSTLSGLLGTVLGIYHSFQNLKTYKEASAQVFADGISEALITTIAGLFIAIPSILFRHIFQDLFERTQDSLTDI